MSVAHEWICDDGCGLVEARGGIDMTARCLNCNATCTAYVPMAEVERLREDLDNCRASLGSEREWKRIHQAEVERRHAMSADPLPALVGLCPVHASEFYAPVDPADPDPKCPACDCRLLVYAPRVDQRDVMAARDRRNAEAGDDALAGEGESDDG